MESNDRQYAILGFGMPIIDYILDYDSSPFLGDEIKQQLSYQNQQPNSALLGRIYASEKVTRNLGGSTLNTIRVVNKVLNSRKAFFIGSVGNDSNAQFIREQLSKEGIEHDLYCSSTKSTSTVIALIEKKERELFANIGSSSELSVDFFKKNHKHFGSSTVIYSDAYLIHYIYESYMYIYSTFANENKTILGIGFADNQILLDYYPQLSQVIPYCDIIFMNRLEFISWTKVSNFTDMDSSKLLNEDIEEYATEFLNRKSAEKVNKNKAFIALITQGKKEALVYWKDFKKSKSFLLKEPRWDYDESSVVDTTGVGDSFAGGFLAGLLLGKAYDECAVIGHYTAAKVLQMKGFQVPEISIEGIEKALESRQAIQSKKADL